MDNSKLNKKAYRTTLYQDTGIKKTRYTPYIGKQGEMKTYKAYDVNYKANINTDCMAEIKPVVVIKFRKDDLKKTKGFNRVYQYLGKIVRKAQDNLINGIGTILKSWRKD